MKRLLFDIETDGFLSQATVIHCIVMMDVDTGKVCSCGPSQVKAAISELKKASMLIGHNIIRFDIPVIKKLYPDLLCPPFALAIPRPLEEGTIWPECVEIYDTLVAARLYYNNRMARDCIAVEDPKCEITKDSFLVWDSFKKKTISCIGRHSLESYGIRFGLLKGDFSKQTDWKEYTEDMLEYCRQDVRINYELYKALRVKKKEHPLQRRRSYFQLEIDTEKVITEQIAHGWLFDKEKAEGLYSKFLIESGQLKAHLQEIFTGWYTNTKTPEYYYIDGIAELGESFKGLRKGELEDRCYEYCKKWELEETRESIQNNIKDGPLKRNYTSFNPGSADHIYRVFKEKYNWKPTVFNKNDKKPTIDDKILQSLPYPEAKIIVRWRVLMGHRAKIAEGKDGGYLAFLDENNRLHGGVITLGTNTYRCTHQRPQLGQVPSSSIIYGKEIRELFIVPGGYKLLGVDASQQEMTVLAHYLYEWDGGVYVRAVTQGSKEERTDPHSINQRNARLASRDEAKLAFYSIIYGAGVGRISSSLGVSFKRAKEIKEQLLNGVPALKHLIHRCEAGHVNRGGIISLDGRKVFTRKKHSALNCLIQSTGAILSKRWLVIIDKMLRDRGIREYCNQVLFLHDELQFEVKEEYVEQLTEVVHQAMAQVEKYYNFNCPLTCDVKTGMTWAETH